MRPEKPDRKIIGWREWVALPALGIPAVKAKIDTGARSSALHAFDIQEFRKNGRPWVRFRVHPFQRNSGRTVTAEAAMSGRRRVRTSGGGVEQRPLIRTALDLLGDRWSIELTLTNRDTMGFRMLLGREAVRGRFVIDVAASFLAGKPPDRSR